MWPPLRSPSVCNLPPRYHDGRNKMDKTHRPTSGKLSNLLVTPPLPPKLSSSKNDAWNPFLDGRLPGKYLQRPYRLEASPKRHEKRKNTSLQVYPMVPTGVTPLISDYFHTGGTLVQIYQTNRQSKHFLCLCGVSCMPMICGDAHIYSI